MSMPCTGMEKQQQDQVDKNIKEAREKLELETEAAHYEHRVMLMKQDLMRGQELWRLEELRNQEVQKLKQLELRQEEELRRREEEVRRQQEEMMRQQQEGFTGTFPDAVYLSCVYDVREQEIRMGQTAMGGAMGINNRGSMPPAPMPPGTPAPPGPATMMPDGTPGLTPPTTGRFGQAATMEGIGAIGGTPPVFNHPAPGAEFAPNKRHRY